MYWVISFFPHSFPQTLYFKKKKKVQITAVGKFIHWMNTVMSFCLHVHTYLVNKITPSMYLSNIYIDSEEEMVQIFRLGNIF